MKFVMDSDHISILQRPSGSEFGRLSNRIRGQAFDEIGFSVISLHEQVMGCHSYINRARRKEEIVRGYGMLERVLRSFSMAPVLPFDMSASETFEWLATKALRVGTMDLRIAAIAISRGLILLTRNAADFGKVPGLLTEDWTI